MCPLFFLCFFFSPDFLSSVVRKSNSILFDADPTSETRSSTNYVPRDEAFSNIKEQQFSKKDTILSVAWIDTIIESAVVNPDQSFQYFTRIDTLFNEGVKLPLLKEEPFWKKILTKFIKEAVDIGEDVLRFKTPETMDSTNWTSSFFYQIKKKNVCTFMPVHLCWEINFVGLGMNLLGGH